MSRLLVLRKQFRKTQLGESFEMDTIFLLFSTECGARKAAVSFGIARSLDGDFGECIWEADSTRGTLGVVLLLLCSQRRRAEQCCVLWSCFLCSLRGVLSIGCESEPLWDVVCRRSVERCVMLLWECHMALVGFFLVK